jgi:hypothetical protein
MLCGLWQRIGQNTNASREKDGTIKAIKVELNCTS